MAHWSENTSRLQLKYRCPKTLNSLLNAARYWNDVCVIRLPVDLLERRILSPDSLRRWMSKAASALGPEATLVVVGGVTDLVNVHEAIGASTKFQHWIVIKTRLNVDRSRQRLPRSHLGALIQTKYGGQLRHVSTRAAYTFCPACNRTTKDYGGKKHTYHEYGTLISDVWRDITLNPQGSWDELYNRLADLFGVEPYRSIQCIDLRNADLSQRRLKAAPTPEILTSVKDLPSDLIQGDCVEELKSLPANSVDFAFADPPYNIGKTYSGYSDEVATQQYFQWCEDWLTQLSRVLRTGGTLAVINIPLWSIRHFQSLNKSLTLQNWIVWDALSFPVRRIMPAHYAILCFAKGEPRILGAQSSPSTQPQADSYCSRASCIRSRRQQGVQDKTELTDLWSDIHRLKHNSRRVDHPCQLPSKLMYRLIEVFSKPGDLVLDCFNGAGTTTLAAHQLGRRYIGIELDKGYHQVARLRHREIDEGLDPFRKQNLELTAKNSRVKRLTKRKYDIPKKTLQLDVRRIAEELGYLPGRNEVKLHSKYPIKYYDEYFTDWGEVCSAARTTGMSEIRRAESIE